MAPWWSFGIHECFLTQQCYPLVASSYFLLSEHFETSSHVAQGGFKLNTQMRMTLLTLLTPSPIGMVGMGHHTWYACWRQNPRPHTKRASSLLTKLPLGLSPSLRAKPYVSSFPLCCVNALNGWNRLPTPVAFGAALRGSKLEMIGMLAIHMPFVL